MTVKSKRGRRRYIAFRTSPGMTRGRMISSIPGGRTFNVIQCAEGMAIVRCSPDNVDECEAAVREADPSAEALCMSGTLRALRGRYPALRRNAPPRPPRKGVPPKTR